MDSGMPGAFVSILTGQKNLASKLSYMSASNTTMKATNRTVQNVLSGEQSCGLNFNQILEDEKIKEAAEIEKIKKKGSLDADGNEYELVGKRNSSTESKTDEKKVGEADRKRRWSPEIESSKGNTSTVTEVKKSSKTRSSRSESSEDLVPKRKRKKKSNKVLKKKNKKGSMQNRKLQCSSSSSSTTSSLSSSSGESRQKRKEKKLKKTIRKLKKVKKRSKSSSSEEKSGGRGQLGVANVQKNYQVFFSDIISC